MKIGNALCCILACWSGLVAVPSHAQPTSGIRYISKQGTVAQLIVDGKPFVALAGELEEQTSTSLESLRPVWPTLDRMNLNTVLPVAYWGLVEPEEGKLDFSLMDDILQEARNHHLRIGFVWFARWKNGLSIYAPTWVQKDFQRFPRSQQERHESLDLLRDRGLWRCHARRRCARFCGLDEAHQGSRWAPAHGRHDSGGERSGHVGRLPRALARADRAYAGPVPKQSMDYLQQHKEVLIPEFRQVWEAARCKTFGTWEEVFGKGAATDEIFEAWNYARYVGRVAEAGKAECPLPMYVNAALHRTSTIADAIGKDREPGRAEGDFAIGGPMADRLDVWRAGAPDLLPRPRPTCGALFLMTSPDELYVIASNEIEVAVELTPNTPGPPLVGVSRMDEGSFVDDRWVQGRSYLDHRISDKDAPLLLPGAFHRIDAHSEHSILRVKLYRYQ